MRLTSYAAKNSGRIWRQGTLSNMVLFHRRFLPLLQRRPMNELKAIADALKTTKELMLKVNSLRERAGLSAIE